MSISPILTITLNPTVDLFGEVDAVRPMRKMRTVNDRCDPGGGGINVARVITEMGGEAEAVFLAGGATGDWLDSLLERDGIHRCKVPIAGATRVAFSALERKSRFDYRFVPQGPAVSAEEIAPCFEIIGARKAAYVVASGSLPAKTPADSYVKMAKLAAKAGGRFVLDSSGEGLRATLAETGVFLVKPSIGELGDLVGQELDEASAGEVALSLVRKGAAEMVAVSMGAYGALLATGSGAIRLPAPRVKARSAIGAGDSFLGAMVWALANDWTVKDAFRLGIAAGAAKVLTPGTGRCKRADIQALYAVATDGVEGTRAFSRQVETG